jgi:hypothetical protein
MPEATDSTSKVLLKKNETLNLWADALIFEQTDSGQTTPYYVTRLYPVSKTCRNECFHSATNFSLSIVMDRLKLVLRVTHYKANSSLNSKLPRQAGLTLADALHNLSCSLDGHYWLRGSQDLELGSVAQLLGLA